MRLSRSPLNRRTFLQTLAASPAILSVHSALAARASYRVGVGNNSDSYTATQTALAASGQFPSAEITGKTVIIKPNLVSAQPSTTGATTDPQVVRAIVDLALAANPKQIIIAEGSCISSAPFSQCGYSFFTTYANPPSLIQLVDLSTQGLTAVKVSATGGLAYNYVWVPVMLTEPNIVFISAGKLKTHYSTGASLSMKNIVGIAPSKKYKVPNLPQYQRMDMHYRSIDETVADLIRVRPIQYAVIDGVWGMEGQGPTQGTAVQANLVFAGLNAMAVDLVALAAIEIPPSSVPYLLYTGNLKLGPTNLNNITITGDSYNPIPFTPATTPPVIWRPSLNPPSLGAGMTTNISYQMPLACYTQVQILMDSDIEPGISVVRTLQPWTLLSAGAQSLTWDGTNDSGVPVAPGVYLVNVQAEFMLDADTQGVNYASSQITVT